MIKEFTSFGTWFNAEQLILGGCFNPFHYLKMKYNGIATNLMGPARWVKVPGNIPHFWVVPEMLDCTKQNSTSFLCQGSIKKMLRSVSRGLKAQLCLSSSKSGCAAVTGTTQK